ncbi:hypothetical protein Golob_003531 [Gossypium lobatum]|uniref:Uncharacterized protein n=1 Tax=Gossypium lobatum TaxID=34289 RepID=A0A7J8MZ34_9ROSI|nr:hypothetical protein [Gossypium lobatum]
MTKLYLRKGPGVKVKHLGRNSML